MRDRHPDENYSSLVLTNKAGELNRVRLRGKLNENAVFGAENTCLVGKHRPFGQKQLHTQKAKTHRFTFMPLRYKITKNDDIGLLQLAKQSLCCTERGKEREREGEREREREREREKLILLT